MKMPLSPKQTSQPFGQPCLTINMFNLPAGDLKGITYPEEHQ